MNIIIVFLYFNQIVFLRTDHWFIPAFFMLKLLIGFLSLNKAFIIIIIIIQSHQCNACLEQCSREVWAYIYETCFTGEMNHIRDIRRIAHIMVSMCLSGSSSILSYGVVSISVKQNVFKVATESGNDEAMFLVKI